MNLSHILSFTEGFEKYKKESKWHAKNIYKYIYKYIYIYEVNTVSFQTFFVQAFKIIIDSWKFSVLLLYML